MATWTITGIPDAGVTWRGPRRCTQRARGRSRRVHERLSRSARAWAKSLAPKVRRAAPIALVTASVLVAGTGASAVTARIGGAAHPADSAKDVLAAGRLRLPDPPQPAAPAPGAGSGSAARPSPSVGRVPRPHHLVEASVLVTSRHALGAKTLRAVRHVSGVRVAQSVAAGHARVDGHRALVLGVNPARFRPWTPKLTARSQQLWQSIARGEMTASVDMGRQPVLPLGATVPVRAASRAPVRLGAFASVGMAGVDAVMSMARAREIG